MININKKIIVRMKYFLLKKHNLSMKNFTCENSKKKMYDFISHKRNDRDTGTLPFQLFQYKSFFFFSLKLIYNYNSANRFYYQYSLSSSCLIALIV